MKESNSLLPTIFRRLAGSVQDLAPIILVIAFFQIVVIQQPFPNLWNVVARLVCVVIGLALFIRDLESCLLPIGEALSPTTPVGGEGARAAPPSRRRLPKPAPHGAGIKTTSYSPSSRPLRTDQTTISCLDSMPGLSWTR